VINVSSKLHDNAVSYTLPSFSFEVYLHPNECVLAVLSVPVSTPSLTSALAYQISPSAVAINQPFTQFVNSVSGCGLVKYTITSDVRPAALTHFNVNSSTKTYYTVTNSFVFTDSASPVLLRYGTMNDHSLLGDYTFTITATLKDWAVFDEIMKIERTFTLSITSVC
jgi:hypothetical protein